MPRQYFIPFLLLTYSTLLLGQSRKQPNIQFETDYIDAVDHWVVLPQKMPEPTCLIGYIFLDEIVGFTFVFQGVLEAENQENWKLINNATYYIIKRSLDSSTPKVHLLSDEEKEQLSLPDKPLWLKLLDERQKTAEELVLLGYHYNKVRRSDLAAPILETAFSMNPAAKNLIFELSFAYNAIGAYDKAIALLENELKKEKRNYMLYRELGYALLQLNNYAAAEKIYERGITLCENEMQKREMAIDMAQTFYELKDEERFEKWAEMLRKQEQ